MNSYQSVIVEWNNAEGKSASSDEVQLIEGVQVYTRSFSRHEGTRLLMVRGSTGKQLLVWGDGSLYQELAGEESDHYKLCGLTHENRLVINRYFPYTVPRAFGKQVATIGLGDRLGLASPGHIRSVRGKNIRPILAQQSIRELNLTGRDYNQVLDAACYAALQEGYTEGFGADGDHLKEEKDIEMALALGFTMLTLDCSDKIDNDVEGLSATAVEERYLQLPQEVRSRYESTYLDTVFEAGAIQISFERQQLMSYALIYGEAIKMTIDIYNRYIRPLDREMDFELSIDETKTPTDPAAHWFVAYELEQAGLDLYSVAPRFCGEFQKGIDYIGDVEQFEKELEVHSAIADHFGYKLSIHSGSDKFSVFPIIANHTKGRFHVKTAGTNWLEAMRTIAEVHPSLYRRMHQYAMEHYPEALAYYHVTTDFDAITPLSEVSDGELAEYMNEDNARQLIHITYGLLLQAKDGEGNSLFRDELMDTLQKHEREYDQALIRHIGRHLELLGK
ncbi:tagaturonate epimerase family protein [Paenibacillus senegalensis]|uniref:tagaturonate epimerase family protein n=1 Tax=Paenibacillus senegalensis TaxID=1465766 RepID=UPI000288273C|nr:tagaturonate epimerase family protein [Paenibacillus senegalensis]